MANIYEVKKNNKLCQLILIDSLDPSALYTIPVDVVITIDMNKELARNQIIDGVTVFERITRKSASITLDFTFRDIADEIKLNINSTFPYQNKWVAPILEIKSFFQNVWLKDRIFTIENEFLNSQGINSIIVESYKMHTLRGNIEIPCTLTCFENYYSNSEFGTTLIKK